MKYLLVALIFACASFPKTPTLKNVEQNTLKVNFAGFKLTKDNLYVCGMLNTDVFNCVEYVYFQEQLK